MPRVLNSDHTGALGVTRVQLVVERDLGWIFRRVEHRDTGIDAEVEIVLNGEATGLILALQIKAGQSYFRSRTTTGWTYRGKMSHLRYWRRHSLPVVLVLVDIGGPTVAAPDGPAIYWAKLPPRVRVAPGSKTFRVAVPHDHTLSRLSATAWMDHAWAASPEDAFFRYCRLQDRYLQHINAGGQLAVEVEEWVNKSSGRASIRLEWLDESGESTGRAEELMVLGVRAAHEYVRALFPWAHVKLDEDYYGVHEDVPVEAVFQDDDSPGGYYEIPGQRRTGMRPYSDNGEVARYRFQLSINRLGHAYLEFVGFARRRRSYPPHYIASIFSK